jgi:hypothetical protein
MISIIFDSVYLIFSAAGLALGKKVDREQENEADPFKITTGGLLDMKNMKDNKKLSSPYLSDSWNYCTYNRNEEEQVTLEGTFASESRQRDEDTRMMKYIDEEMAKRKGVKQQTDEDPSGFEARKASLYALPENLKVI